MAKIPETNSLMEMFAAFGKDLPLPKMDVDAIIQSHRKNFEALQKSASVTASGASALLARQRDVMQEAMRDITEMAKGIHPSDPRDIAAKQAEFLRRAFDATVKNTVEVVEIAQKSGTESVEILKERIRESMDEIRTSFNEKK